MGGLIFQIVFVVMYEKISAVSGERTGQQFVTPNSFVTENGTRTNGLKYRNDSLDSKSELRNSSMFSRSPWRRDAEMCSTLELLVNPSRVL